MSIESVYDLLWMEYAYNPYLGKETRTALVIAVDVIKEAISDPKMFLKIQKILEEHSVEEEEDDC